MKPFRFVVLIGAISSMGLASPQCTAVDRTVSSKGSGFIDEELVGRYPDDDLEIVITQAGDLELTRSDPDSRVLFEVWSTEIDGRRYFNWPINRPYDCIGCDPEELAQILREPEAVFVLLYATDVESLAGPALDSRYTIPELERREGEWIAYAWMDPDFSVQAVDMGLIGGDCEGACSSSPTVRLMGNRRTLRSFVAEYTDRLYLEWIIMWREQRDE